MRDGDCNDTFSCLGGEDMTAKQLQRAWVPEAQTGGSLRGL
jgi:hypothetical protein